MTDPSALSTVNISVPERLPMGHLRRLESEAVFVLREAVAQCERRALLFSGGKDSIVLAHLARKAFWPGSVPFPLLHIDTGHNFAETLSFRDAFAHEQGWELIVRTVQDSIDRGRCHDETGAFASRNGLQTVTLLDAIAEMGLDAVLGGARRDEEKARAKERFFSHRDAFGQWDPRNQRPELWTLFNGRKSHGEHFRIFPLSNWTEMDVWQYIAHEGICVPSLYFAHTRDVFRREGQLLARSPWVTLVSGEHYETKLVRFRTVGDATCTGAIESSVSTIDDVLLELTQLRTAERGTRADDQRSEAAMEDRKRRGYF